MYTCMEVYCLQLLCLISAGGKAIPWSLICWKSPWKRQPGSRNRRGAHLPGSKAEFIPLSLIRHPATAKGTELAARKKRSYDRRSVKKNKIYIVMRKKIVAGNWKMKNDNQDGKNGRATCRERVWQ